MPVRALALNGVDCEIPHRLKGGMKHSFEVCFFEH